MSLYLTNAASLKTPGHRGPGVVWAAMAAPPAWLLRSGARILPTGAATVEDLVAHRRQEISTEEYFRRFRALLDHRVVYDLLSPGRLGARDRLVQDGDTLVCTCPRPDSPRRLHRCHLEELAPYLERARWQIVLYGERRTEAA